MKYNTIENVKSEKCDYCKCTCENGICVGWTKENENDEFSKRKVQGYKPRQVTYMVYGVGEG